MKLTVTVLGARGSVPVSGKAFSRYGGATTCVLFCADGQYLVLDAGTGLLSLPDAALKQDTLPLVLTHPHADHLLGLPLCPYAMKPGARLDIYTTTRDGLDGREQVRRMLSPPLWPVGTDQLPADIRFHELTGELRLGAVTVKVMEGDHPGGVSLLRLEADGKCCVFATDYTLTPENAPRFADFVHGCDLLLCDGQYCDDEWPERSAFGHSSWGYVARFARGAGVRRLRIVHHDPFRTDEELDRAAEKLRGTGFDYDFAKEGEVICL